MFVPLYAIVDIETTGGQPNANRITEICILIHNGNEVVERFETLINPEIPIPLYLQAFTGITDAMVKDAPLFKDVADKIYKLLKDKIFIAHNVNFDYNFVKHQLEECGINFSAKRLCTVRLARKLIPGKPSYSLGNLCAAMGIHLQNRHRAGGDSEATANLFGRLMQLNALPVITEMLLKGSKEQQLPPNLNKDEFEQLPKTPGVYYFIDERGLALYVGKAKNIKSRVSSHFSGKMFSKQKQNFMRNIYGLSFLQTGNELLASLIESHEIKRLWPNENRSQKKHIQLYGLYDYPDQYGKIRLGIDKLRKDIMPLATFSNLTVGLSYLNQVVNEFKLCPKLCNLQQPNTECRHTRQKVCLGDCLTPQHTETYNAKVNEFFKALEQEAKLYIITGAGRTPKEQAVIVYEPSRFVGYCFISRKEKLDFDQVQELATPLKLNQAMEAIITKVIEDPIANKNYKIYTQLKMAMV
jgi:DNA polymerase-3 subunit epsilon